MAAPFTEEDVGILGYDEIEPTALGSDAAIGFTARLHAGMLDERHCLIYVKSDADRAALEKVALEASRLPSYFVLTSKSGLAESTLRLLFKKAVKIVQLDDLIWQRVYAQFEKYAESIGAGTFTEPNFIAPRYKEESSDSLKDRLDSVLFETLVRDPKSGPHKNLTCLKAPAGVGKTTLCRQVVTRLAKQVKTHRLIPVYVESAHWASRVDSVDSLWELIHHSLQHFDHSSRFTRALFERALKRGFLAFIFDGFDELCGNRKFSMSAREVLDDILGLVEDSDARIVVTSRTQYWDSEIGSEDGVRFLDLLPFNPQQAKVYIRRFFSSSDDQYERARQIYSKTVASGNNPANRGGARANFWTLPIAVSMICEAVKAGVEVDGGKSFTVHSLLEGICERETKRQSLSASGKRQMEVFQELALLRSELEVSAFSIEDLQAAGISESDSKKFLSHPLIRVAEEGDLFFSYDFLTPFFRAEVVRTALTEARPEIRPSVIEVMGAQENGKGFLIDHVVRLCEDTSVSQLQKAARLLEREKAARSFLFHVACAISRMDPNVVSARERARAVFGIFRTSDDSLHPDRYEVSKMRFVGLLDGLDVSGFTFRRCEFVDVAFRSFACDGACFNDCVFDGQVEFGSDADAHGFARADFVRCEFRGESRVALEPAIATRADEREDLLRDLLDAGLSKFWHNGKFKGSIRGQDWSKGVLSRSRRRDALLEVFVRVGLVKHVEISGVKEGGYGFNREAIGDLQNFMDHRQLTGLVAKAFQELDRSVG